MTPAITTVFVRIEIIVIIIMRETNEVDLGKNASQTEIKCSLICILEISIFMHENANWICIICTMDASVKMNAKRCINTVS